MRNVFCAVVLSLFSASLSAEIVDVEYKRFYSHVKKLDSEDTADLQFAFGFLHVRTKSLCEINSAQIVTDKKIIPLDVSSENRFTVPSERALNLADASVQIDLVDAANMCDMSVQLETKPELLQQTYSQQELQQIYSQYAAFFSEMGSFLSFLMPSVKGLMIHFNDDSLSTVLPSGHQIQHGMLLLNDDELANLKELQLPQKPLRITALAKK